MFLGSSGPRGTLSDSRERPQQPTLVGYLALLDYLHRAVRLYLFHIFQLLRVAARNEALSSTQFAEDWFPVQMASTTPSLVPGTLGQQLKVGHH